MSTPQEKLDALVAKASATVSADVAKVKSVWASYEVYVVAAVSLLVGAVVGHIL